MLRAILVAVISLSIMASQPASALVSLKNSTGTPAEFSAFVFDHIRTVGQFKELLGKNPAAAEKDPDTRFLKNYLDKLQNNATFGTVKVKGQVITIHDGLKVDTIEILDAPNGKFRINGKGFAVKPGATMKEIFTQLAKQFPEYFPVPIAKSTLIFGSEAAHATPKAVLGFTIGNILAFVMCYNRDNGIINCALAAIFLSWFYVIYALLTTYNRAVDGLVLSGGHCPKDGVMEINYNSSSGPRTVRVQLNGNLPSRVTENGGNGTTSYLLNSSWQLSGGSPTPAELVSDARYIATLKAMVQKCKENPTGFEDALRAMGAAGTTSVTPSGTNAR